MQFITSIKFAKFNKKILVASNEKDISLADELETMQLYINIENIRFSNEIDYTINLSEHVNPKNIRVPSLILQPFLETLFGMAYPVKLITRK